MARVNFSINVWTEKTIHNYTSTIIGVVSKSEVLSASNVPRKLRNLSEVFHHKDDYTDTVKQEVKVNKIDTENLFTSEKQDKEKKQPQAVRVGKLKLEENIFEKTEEDLNLKKSPEVKVVKIINVLRRLCWITGILGAIITIVLSSWLT